MTSNPPFCLPPATKGAARAVAAPAAPALGVCTRSYVKGSTASLPWPRVEIRGQSGAGMLNGWHSIATLVDDMPQRAAAAPSKRSAGAVAERGAINFGGCVAPQTASVPDGNHGDNFPESAA
ncbi:hypothetical protein C8C99_4027 [Acidovorax sp. 107]|nr:hypothetical protein C8C99_4027 [Acidovorax sp. 107]